MPQPFERWLTFSLSPRERAGVRGNGGKSFAAPIRIALKQLARN